MATHLKKLRTSGRTTDGLAIADGPALAAPSRRDALRVLGAGLLLAMTASPATAQTAPGGNRGGPGAARGGGRRGGSGGRGGGAKTVAARLHIGRDGVITVMTSKVECGQGSRAELTQAAAEELRVGADQVRLIMGDTGLTPDDGGTAGSQSTPSSVPAIRRGCAAARGLLVSLAAARWGVEAATLAVSGGEVTDPAMRRTLSYADLASDEAGVKAFEGAIPQDVTLTPVEAWKVMGTSVEHPTAATSSSAPTNTPPTSRGRGCSTARCSAPRPTARR